MPRKSIDDIREFTKRGNNSEWLLSPDSYTFTLEGKNLGDPPGSDKSTSKGEINTLTNFDSPENKSKDDDLKRFFLILYCLQNEPYKFNSINQVIDYSKDGKLFLPSLQTFFNDYQTSTIKDKYSRSLTTDIVRTYRKDKKITGDTEKQINKDVQKLLDFAKTNPDYKKNVAGVLGKVTYDSVVKHTLYSLLKKNGIIKDYEKSGKSWSEAAAILEPEHFDFFIDVGGGTYSRAFPTVCVFIKSSKKAEELKTLSNEFISSKFSRTVVDTQLVTPLKIGNEKQIVTLPNRDSGDFLYCFIYDFAKIIVLQPLDTADYTLDLLKISLSFFSRKYKTFNNKAEFVSFYKKIIGFIESNFSEIKDNYFSILYTKKHSLESAYALSMDSNTLKNKLEDSFNAEINIVAEGLESVYSKVMDIFDLETKKGGKQNFQFKDYPSEQEYPLTLHFDNFYNLLAITTKNLAPNKSTNEYDLNIPFKMEEYEYEYTTTNITGDFFTDIGTGDLITVPPKADLKDQDYFFEPSMATENDIVLITDFFLKQTYENLDTTGKGFVYETDSNQFVDDVKSSKSIELINLISKRTGLILEAKNYFTVSGGKTNLKNDIIKKLELDELFFLFKSAGIDSIKFQTINHLLFLNLEELPSASLTIDDFKSRIYYPILKDASKSPTPKKDDPPVMPSIPKGDGQSKDLLINNIITSQFSCYEDILKSFDKAKNADKGTDKLYYALQALVNMGLPILLSLAAQAIANKLAELKKIGDPLHPSLLECLNADRDNLKKSILGYADLLTNLDNPKELLGLLSQGMIELPQIPAIPFFATFDAEKELKRRLLEYVIGLIIKLLTEQLEIAIKPIMDMCNADSYLTAFLSSAFPNKDQSGQKLGSATASGLPAGSSATVYSPTILSDINSLIDESGIETKENVYKIFRGKFQSPDITDQKISDFFDFLSNSIDAGELASLLKGSSTIECRMTVLSYIKNYKDGLNPFFMIFNSSQAVSDLFLFLSLYIDYNLCYKTISESLVNYAANVCVDIDSKFEERSLKFGEPAVEDEIADLSNSLDDICKSKNSLVIDILTGGPSLLTKGLNNVLATSYDSVIHSVSANKDIVLPTDKDIVLPADKQEFVDKFNIKIRNLTLILKNSNVKYEFFYTNINLYFTTPRELAIDTDTTTNFIKFLFKLNKDSLLYTKLNKKFKPQLLSIGNIGLKTELASISGYASKLKSIDGEKDYFGVEE